jgi:ubiquinone/menaquinone biosynthesis C-methylase UbiE
MCLRVIGSDCNRAVLENAACQPGPSLTLVQHDAAVLPFADGSVDLVTLSLAAHHLTPAQLRAALAEAWRVARYGLVVSDLERGTLAYVSSRLMALVLRNRLTSHDGPVSVLRAYTAPELRRIALAAGVSGLSVRRRFPYRIVLAARKGGRA